MLRVLDSNEHENSKIQHLQKEIAFSTATMPNDNLQAMKRNGQ